MVAHRSIPLENTSQIAIKVLLFFACLREDRREERKYNHSVMAQFIAFLRALNTGKNRTITMASLRQVFESLGFSGVATAFSSGNVVFETYEQNASALEEKIEKGLREAQGLNIATFVRTDLELAAIAAYQPFPQPVVGTADEFNIIFLDEMADEETTRNVLALKTAVDEFIVHGREIYWLRHKKPGEVSFSPVPLGKAIRGSFTIRTANVVTRIAKKHCSTL